MEFCSIKVVVHLGFELHGHPHDTRVSLVASPGFGLCSPLAGQGVPAERSKSRWLHTLDLNLLGQVGRRRSLDGVLTVNQAVFWDLYFYFGQNIGSGSVPAE